MDTLYAFGATFVWGIIHFITAIPGGMLTMHLPPTLAAIAAGAGYVAIGAAMLVIGTPARNWIVKKFKISAEPDRSKLFWRIWLRWGMPGLGLVIAPLLTGPYFAALIALALGEKPPRLLFWLIVGVIPWCILFAVLTASGVNILKYFGK